MENRWTLTKALVLDFIFLLPERKPLGAIDALFNRSKLETGISNPYRIPRIEPSLRWRTVHFRRKWNLG